MRNKFLFFLFVAAAVVLFTATAVGAANVCVLNLDERTYNVEAERMFQGTIAGKGHVLEGLMYLPLRTSTAVLELQIGPKEFVESRNMKLTTGDVVTVIGVP